MLLPHNIPVFENLLKGIDKYKSVVLVSATGTGKSYIISELLEKKNQNALVIVPNCAIKSTWRELTNRVHVITYHNFHKHVDRYIGQIDKYDNFIFDEAHHVGAKAWGKSVRKFKNVCDKPIIGLTATPIRYTDNCKNIVDELWDGIMVEGYSTKDALDAGILPNIHYICALYDTTGIKNRFANNISLELKGKLDMCIQNIKKCTDILRSELSSGKNKGIVFVDSIDSIQSGIDLIKDVFPDEDIWWIHSKQSKKHNERIIDEFNDAQHGYIVTVDMFNEGKHTNGIDTLIMLRKTCSPLVFLQQLGRGLSSKGKNVKVFDFVSNHLSITTFTNRQNTIIELTTPTEKTTKKSSQVIVDNYLGEIYCILDTVEKLDDNHWTEEEDNIIRNYYPIEGPEVYKRLPGRTRAACKARARYLNITCMNYWTEEEDNIIRNYYHIEGPEVYKRLPGRTKQSCKDRAHLLGVIFTKKWTEEEDNIIRNYYPIEGPEVYKRLPGRTKSACKSRAKYLNITYDRYIWTEEEDNILREYYPIEGAEVYKRLPGRTKSACIHRVYKLGITLAEKKDS